MPQCCVPRCFNRSESKAYCKLSFHRFPCDEKKKREWLQLIRRENFTPNCNSRVCSWHFPDGKDAGPTRFAWNEGKSSQFPNNHKKGHNEKKWLVPAGAENRGKTSDEPVADNAHTQAPTASISSSSSLLLLQIENVLLREENKKLKKQLEKQKQTFSFSQISDNLERVQYYTGLPDAATVLLLEAILSKFELNYYSAWTVKTMPLIDQLFLTLIKLKLNCGHLDLATRFNCSSATVSNIFTTLVSALYDILYVGVLENNIPLRTKNQTSLPDGFQPFPNSRIVLDCTDVSVSNTERLDTQSHKGCTTLKALIGVAPSGAVTFTSDLYGGSASDKPITADCGVQQPGDTATADKGFTVWDILPEGDSMNVLPVLVSGQFTQEEVNNTRQEGARIHVDHSIQRLKHFSILDGVPHQFRKNINKILKVCVCLSNLQIPILREIESRLV